MKKNIEKTGWRVLQRIVSVIGGRPISLDFFLRNLGPVFMLLYILIGAIAAKYTYLLDLDRVRQLERDLEISKTEYIRVKNLYMSKIRESEMTQMVDSLNLNLTIQKKPPFHVTF